MPFLFHQKICSFLKRHKNKFIFTGVFLGGVIGSLKYAEYKINSFVAEDQKKMMERKKREKAFDQVQLHACSLVEVMLDSVLNKVLMLNDTEVILRRLKDKEHGKKLELWNQLKVGVFSRLVAGIYCLNLVTITVQVQLHQLAARGDVQTYSENLTVQVFLSLCHKHMLSEGIAQVSELCHKITNDIIGSMPLQHHVGGENIETALRSIFSCLMREMKIKASDTELEGAFHPALPSYNIDDEFSQNEKLPKNWLELTFDILESTDCSDVFFECFRESVNFIAEDFTANIENMAMCSKSSYVEDEDIMPLSIPLAKALPLLNTKLKSVYSADFLQRLMVNPIMGKFAFNVYKSCFDLPS
ncbi:peroxisomal biogenesis factor 3 [Ciona intestinalis]